MYHFLDLKLSGQMEGGCRCTFCVLMEAFHMQSPSSSGSGLILESDGTILTSAQIVSAAAETRRGINGKMQLPKVLITLQDGRIFRGRVISSDRQAAAWNPYGSQRPAS